MRFEPGAPIDVVMTKWGDRPHWEFPVLYLGSDGYGDWAGIPAGTRFSRPGADYVAPVDQVTLVPRLGLLSNGAGGPCDWLASFHDDGGPDVARLAGPVDVYVDITTRTVFDGTTLRSVDLDLDVIRGKSGRVWIDDEDEFAAHRVAFGYPDDVVAAAVETCDLVRDAALAQEGAFAKAASGVWLERLRRS